MFSFEQRWTRRIFEGLFPAGQAEGFAQGGDSGALGGFVTDLVRYAPPISILGLRAATWIIWWGPLFFVGRLRTFEGLSPETQARMLTRMSTSALYPIREVALLVKTIGSLGFCSRLDVQAQVGITFDGAEEPAWTRADGGRP